MSKWQPVNYIDVLIEQAFSSDSDRDNTKWHVSDIVNGSLRHCWAKRKGLPNLRPKNPSQDAAFLIGHSIHFEYQRITRKGGISVLQEGEVGDEDDVVGKLDDLILMPHENFLRVWDYKTMKSGAVRGWDNAETGTSKPKFNPDQYPHYEKQVNLYAYLAMKSGIVKHSCWFCRYWPALDYKGKCPNCAGVRTIEYKLDKPIGKVGMIAQSKNLDWGLDKPEFESDYDPSVGIWYEERVKQLRHYWDNDLIPPAEELEGWKRNVRYNGYARYEFMSEEELREEVENLGV